MAKVKIKEGSLTIEVEDDSGKTVFSRTFKDLNYNDIDIEVWQRKDPEHSEPKVLGKIMPNAAASGARIVRRPHKGSG